MLNMQLYNTLKNKIVQLRGVRSFISLWRGIGCDIFVSGFVYQS